VHRVQLLHAPSTRECLEWKKPDTGAVNPGEFCFLAPQHWPVTLLPRPRVWLEPLEIEQPSGEDFLERIDLDPLEPPGTTVVPFQFAIPQQADCSVLLGPITEVSRNLFRPIGKSATGGKSYSAARPALTGRGVSSLAEPASGKNRASQNGYRKSYTETKNADGSTTRRGMTLWDLLLPLLQPPPFDLRTREQVFLPAELLPHQPQGVEFLATREAALLGDGVQTGKTIQTIVAMKLLFQLGKIESALIVCPIPLLMHWQKQLEKWAPELWQGLTVVRNGPDRRRIMWQMPAHVYATNYETLVGDFDQITAACGGKGFSLIVADEVQKIKNRKGGFEQLRQLGRRAKYRWGLSATPLENSVEDLVSIFEFLKPGLLRPNQETELWAKEKIKPYFLRRRTADVARHFKEPRHDNVFVKMEGRQLEAYDRAFNDSVADLKRMGKRVTLADALAKLQALKQICNVDRPSGESAKLDWLKDTVEEISASGDKALVFTQYKESGRDFLARRLEEPMCITYDSQGSDAQKQKWIRAFSEDPGRTVFLGNPKVAGVGLPDLKVANYVIHFDHWWNPAVEDQANGRILGIGQKKDAFIIHLWVENSIEGRIQAILARKRDLFGRVIDSQSNVDGTGLTEKELFELFGLEAPEKRPPPTRPPSRATTGVGPPAGTSLPDLQTQCGTTIAPQQLSPSEFEDLVARLHSALGYAVRRTPATRDGGVDVIAVRDHPTGREKLAIQCKHQEKPVGRPELQKLLGVLASDPSFSAGVLVTTTTFSSEARQFAEQNARIQLVDKNTLARLIAQNRVAVKEHNGPMGRH
jgi:superfamily II DNA or RNA helicase